MQIQYQLLQLVEQLQLRLLMTSHIVYTRLQQLVVQHSP
jgi:hypothetical protein